MITIGDTIIINNLSSLILMIFSIMVTFHLRKQFDDSIDRYIESVVMRRSKNRLLIAIQISMGLPVIFSFIELGLYQLLPKFVPTTDIRILPDVKDVEATSVIALGAISGFWIFSIFRNFMSTEVSNKGFIFIVNRIIIKFFIRVNLLNEEDMDSHLISNESDNDNNSQEELTDMGSHYCAYAAGSGPPCIDFCRHDSKCPHYVSKSDAKIIKVVDVIKR